MYMYTLLINNDHYGYHRDFKYIHMLSIFFYLLCVIYIYSLRLERKKKINK